MSIKNHSNFLELVKKKNKEFSLQSLVDEIDFDYYFFQNFLDVHLVQSRVSRLSLFKELYSIKEFTFDPHTEYQSFKLEPELHLTRNEFSIILKSLSSA